MLLYESIKVYHIILGINKLFLLQTILKPTTRYSFEGMVLGAGLEPATQGL
jgi:hypothetical protein